MSTELERSGHYALVRSEGEEARRTLTRGVMLLVSIPVAVAAMVLLCSFLDSFGPVLIALIYCIIAGPTGLVMTTLGVIQSRNAAKRLAELDRERLPEARLLR